MDGKFAKVLVGNTRAVYGDGAQIEDLFTGEQSRRFIIENLIPGCSVDVVKKMIQEKFGSVIDIKIIGAVETNTAIITMSTIQEAEKAIGVLQTEIPKAFRGRRQLSVHGIPEATEAQKAHLSSTIEISCHYPSRLAWAHYCRHQTALGQATRLDGTSFDGRTITATLQTPATHRDNRGFPRYSGNFTVTIANLPECVTEQHLQRRTRADDVTIQEASYTTAEVKRHLAAVLPKFGTLENWEMAPILPGAKKLYAFARYSSVQESRSAMKALVTRTTVGNVQSDIKFYCWLVNSMKYTVRNDLWGVLEKQVQSIIDYTNNANNDRSGFIRLSLYDSDESLQVNRKFRVYGKDIKALGKVKSAVDALLKGEVFLHGDAVFWHEVFETASGIQFLNGLEHPHTVAVWRDMRTRTIRFYGDSEPRNAIKAKLLAYVESVEAEQTKVALNRSELRTLLSGGLRTLQTTLGHENVRLNITKAPELFLKKKDVAKALVLIRSLPTQEMLSTEDQEECPICFCEIEDPVSLDCHHACCRSCMNHQIYTAVRARTVPLTCTICAKPIGLSILHQFRDFDELLVASFISYISSNPTKFENCPTADCPQVYRIGSTSESVVQCSECLAEICTSCKVIWHEGMSCAEMRAAKDPDNLKTKKLMRELGIHPCPRCSTNIEKTYGCNHMTCSACQTHFCWYCMEDFGLGNGSLVYEHMRKEHGDLLY